MGLVALLFMYRADWRNHSPSRDNCSLNDRWLAEHVARVVPREAGVALDAAGDRGQVFCLPWPGRLPEHEARRLADPYRHADILALQRRLHLEPLLQRSSERARIAVFAIVSKGAGDRCITTVAASTRFTATTA